MITERERERKNTAITGSRSIHRGECGNSHVECIINDALNFVQIRLMRVLAVPSHTADKMVSGGRTWLARGKGKRRISDQVFQRWKHGGRDGGGWKKRRGRRRRRRRGDERGTRKGKASENGAVEQNEKERRGSLTLSLESDSSQSQYSRWPLFSFNPACT